MPPLSEKEALIQELKQWGITNRKILEVIERIPREKFVPKQLRDKAYQNRPLPIGENQTISQPYTVAYMMELLQLQGGEKILEIGTGSGYQAALLSQIAHEVYSVERISSLAQQAKNILQKLGCSNVHVVVGDGTKGLKQHAPYDGIVVTAGAPSVPNSLQEQLTEGGRLIIPVGQKTIQHMTRVTRRGNDYEKEVFSSFMFVPLIGEEGWTT